MNEQQLQQLRAEYQRARNTVDALVLALLREQGLAAQLEQQERQAQQQQAQAQQAQREGSGQ